MELERPVQGRDQNQERPKALVSRIALVWDRGVRWFHWSLVVAVAVCLSTGFLLPRNWLDVHLWSGALIGMLLLHRLVWGFFGTTYARFSNFLVSPRRVALYATSLLRGQAGEHIGHNPLGGAMIVALLVTLVALGATGLLTLGGALKEGPFAVYVTNTNGQMARRVHECVAYALLALIILHVTGVAAESLRIKANLAAGMLTGRRQVSAHAHQAPAIAPRTTLAVMTTIGLIAAIAAGVWHLSEQKVPGVPGAIANAVYAKECSSCHEPYHPSIAPKAVWQGIMSGLVDHFGDNAELPADLAIAIANYLDANASDIWDTTASKLFEQGPAAAGNGATSQTPATLRMTDAPGWRRIHSSVPMPIFAMSSVAGRHNCSKCHRDAETGHFSPRQIYPPKPPMLQASNSEKELK